MLSTIKTFIENNPTLCISLFFGIISCVVNIILAIFYKDKAKVKDALASLSDVINTIEELSSYKKLTSVEKKAAAESLLIARYGKSFLIKHKNLFDDAIEDILSTPQKKGVNDAQEKN